MPVPLELDYQGMRWIRPKRIRTAAIRAIRTAQESSEMRGADLALVFAVVLLILILLHQDIWELEKSGTESFSQVNSWATAESAAEAATRPTRRRAGAGSGASWARSETVVAWWD